ncbi:MAG: FG-GAP-like repeat-containing protein, partial [bacterium]
MNRPSFSGKTLLGVLCILLGIGITESHGVNFRLFNNWGNQVNFEGGRTGFAFADIDGDGWLEFLSIGDHGSPNINANEHGIMTFFNRQQGQSWEVVMEGNFGYGMIAVGDINNDGEWDVGYAMHHPYNQGDLGNQMIEAALGNGSGRNWQPWDDDLAVPRQGDDWYGMFGVDLGDFDNDGLLDLGSNSFGSGSGLHIYRNRGDGSWEDVYYFFGRNNSDMYFYFADFNNDGNLDVGAALHNRSLFFGDGNGRFEPAPTNGLPEQPATGYLQGGSVGDIDRDGADDIVFCNANYGISVYRFNQGENRWESLSGALPQQSRYMTALADFDGDGWLDIIAHGPEGIELWLQRPEQNERWVRDRVIGFQNYRGLNALHCTDLDHNGRPDAVAMVNIIINLFITQNYLYILFEDSEPGELSIKVDEPGGGEVFRMGSARFIRWTSAIPGGEDAGRVDIHFSPNGQQGDWELVAQNIPNSGLAQWRVPRRRTQNGVLRLTLHLGDEEVVAYSRPFTILPAGNVPILEVEPARIDFGVVAVGDEVRRAVILRNSGNDRLSFDSIRVRPPFRWMMEMIDLEPGEETEGRVIFLTQQEGFFPDTLRIYSNGGNAYIPLLARTPNARGPMLLFRPDSLDFGRVHVDSSEERISFLVNIGDRATTVNLAQLPNSPFHYPAWREELIEAGDSIPLTVIFTPPRARRYEGIAQAISPFSQAELHLLGIGYGQPMLIPTPDTLRFGRVLITQFREMDVQIVNVGDEDARISIPQSRNSAFQWRAIPDSTLSPQDTLLIRVRFVPQEV